MLKIHNLVLGKHCPSTISEKKESESWVKWRWIHNLSRSNNPLFQILWYDSDWTHSEPPVKWHERYWYCKCIKWLLSLCLLASFVVVRNTHVLFFSLTVQNLSDGVPVKNYKRLFFLSFFFFFYKILIFKFIWVKILKFVIEAINNISFCISPILNLDCDVSCCF